MQFKFMIGVVMALAATGAFAEAGPAVINQSSLLVTMAGFFGLGILLAFTPCVLPMVPILSAILVGHGQQDTKRAFRLSLVFVFSMAGTYALAGMLAGYLGSTLQ